MVLSTYLELKNTNAAAEEIHNVLKGLNDWINVSNASRLGSSGKICKQQNSFWLFSVNLRRADHQEAENRFSLATSVRSLRLIDISMWRVGNVVPIHTSITHYL